MVIGDGKLAMYTGDKEAPPVGDSDSPPKMKGTNSKNTVLRDIGVMSRLLVVSKNRFFGFGCSRHRLSQRVLFSLLLC